MAKKRQRAVSRPEKSSLPDNVKLVRTLAVSSHVGSRMRWSPDGTILAIAAGKHKIKLWDVKTGECLMALSGHTSMVTSVAFSPDGSRLASSSRDLTVRIWDLSAKASLATLRDHPYALEDVSWSQDGRFIAAASTEASLVIWDAISHRLIRKGPLTQGGRFTVGVAWASDSVRLAAASFNAFVFDLTKKPIQELESDYGVYDVAFSPDPASKWLAAASYGRVVVIWDSLTGKKLIDLEGHTGSVRRISFSGDGKYLASASNDSVRLWRCDDWQPLLVLETQSRGTAFPAIAFQPNSYRLAVSRISTIQILDLDLDRNLKQADEATIKYTSAKVVMVGESNVGKSYLAHRIATGKSPEKGKIKSTHGMTFWPMEPKRLDPATNTPAGQRRDVVLWDMGGQEEYRLVHQLFLRDTTVALVLFDPTRGQTAFREVETWNKYLEKQLGHRLAKKLLVGAKIDQPVDTIDVQAVNQLKEEGGFTGYYESSAITGRGVTNLCKALSQVIDWDHLGKTSRPELFQQIRDNIEARRKRGDVVLPLRELEEQFGSKAVNSGSQRSNKTTRNEAVRAVADQLAMQGLLAQSKIATGEPVLVLQIQEIERYAGSLIIAARNNPRGVPALELSALAQANFSLPGIAQTDRLPREQEKPVIECTVQLLLEHGICFEHESLLIFPSLFTPITVHDQTALPSSVSLYYDFAGAIDNIYASLVAWLVLARDFGRVRLWADRAEFEVEDGGLCGLHKVGRPGGLLTWTSTLNRQHRSPNRTFSSVLSKNTCVNLE